MSRRALLNDIAAIFDFDCRNGGLFLFATKWDQNMLSVALYPTLFLCRYDFICEERNA
ncbi:hypothetical protein INT80_14910 [Gallibacterium anatis]|uniref:Uncharacterized protein n=1 Tax=Gallibacterium anatis TaxID=750 RepID=A0A930UXD6_9PAST|nr:hypothetical protein [Gallibacterium anatis]